MASNLTAMASKLTAMASNLMVMASKLIAMVSNLEAMASNLIALASNLEGHQPNLLWPPAVLEDKTEQLSSQTVRQMISVCHACWSLLVELHRASWFALKVFGSARLVEASAMGGM